VAQTSILSLANSAGATFRTNLNTILAALFSENSGATAPTVTVAGMVWFDTTTAPGVLKVRNSTDAGWISINATDFATLAEALAGTLTTKAINPDVLKKILDGVASAPRIVGAAHMRLADMPVLTVAATDVVSVENLIDIVDGTLSSTSSSYVTAYTMTIRQITGSARFRLTHTSPAGGATDCRLSITKNGAEQANWLINGAGTQARSLDIAVVPTDVIVWRFRREGSSGTCSVSNRATNANNGYVERPAYVTYLNRDTP
jgi:hypothetical protein